MSEFIDNCTPTIYNLQHSKLCGRLEYKSLWESFPARNEGRLSNKLCGNLCLNSSSFQQSISENHVGSFQLGPPILNILSWGQVAQPVAPQQSAEQGVGEGREGVVLIL